MKPFSIKLQSSEVRDRRWAIVPNELGDCWGITENGTRTIRLDPRARADVLLNTLIHEALHAIYGDLSEEAVLRGADSLTDLLLHRQVIPTVEEAIRLRRKRVTKT